MSETELPTDDVRLFPLSKAPAEIERMHGVRPHRSAIYRWVKRGTSGVRLQVRAIGGTLHTSRPWLEEFFDAVTAAKAPQQSNRRPARRRMSTKQAEKYLVDEGVLKPDAESADAVNEVKRPRRMSYREAEQFLIDEGC